MSVIDLSGNVREWDDCCDDTTGSLDVCIYRGGAFASTAPYMRCDSINEGNRSSAQGDTCCVEVGANPTFEVYEAFLEAYPASTMPKTWPDVASFSPQAGQYKMKWSEMKPGNEFVDVSENGGLIEDNVAAGRAFAREQAEKDIPAGGVIVAIKEDPVTIVKLAGEPLCDGVGWGWGSFLYQMPDFSVGEMVYLYIGYCAEIPHNDGEVFQYSDEPVVVCSAPIVK